MKTKYRFRDRQSAEDAERVSKMLADNLSVALNAFVNGNYEWLPRSYGAEKNGAFPTYYRFGIIKRKFCVLLLVRFHADGQADQTAVYAEDWLSDEIRRWEGMALNAEEIAYRDGLYDLRRAMNAAIDSLI